MSENKRKTQKTRKHKTKTKPSSHLASPLSHPRISMFSFILKILKMLVSFYLHVCTSHALKSSLLAGFQKVCHYRQFIKVNSSSQSSLIKLFSRVLTCTLFLVSVLTGLAFLPISLTTYVSCSSVVCSLAQSKILCFGKLPLSCSQLLNSSLLFQLTFLGWYWSCLGLH